MKALEPPRFFPYACPMNRLSPYLRRTGFLLVALVPVLLLFCAQIALGQETEEEVLKESWSLSYLLVVVGIALGLVAVCRPGSRHKEIQSTDE